MMDGFALQNGKLGALDKIHNVNLSYYQSAERWVDDAG